MLSVFSSKALIIDCLHVCFLIPGLTISTLLLYLTLVLGCLVSSNCVFYILVCFVILLLLLLLKGRHNVLDERNCAK